MFYFRPELSALIYCSKSDYMYNSSVLSYYQSCILEGLSWSWSYGSWIYNYLCNQCLSPLKFEPCSWWGVLDKTLCDKVCQWLTTGQWFSPGFLLSSTNKTDCHDITEILLKVALNTINQPTCILEKWLLVRELLTSTLKTFCIVNMVI